MCGNKNSYTYVKSIAEELRGLAQEYNVPLLTATQTTRGGYCLDLNTIVNTQNGKKMIKDVVVGDILESNNGSNVVKTIFPVQEKQCYRITTKSGKQIICSGDHIFPTNDNMLEKNIHSGLSVGDKLHVKS